MSTCRSEKGKSTSIAAVHIFCTVKSQFFYFGQFGQIFRTSPRKCGTPYIFRRKRKWDFSSSLKLPNYFLVTIRRKSKLQMLLSWILPSYWLTNQGLQDSCLSLTLGKAIQNHLSNFFDKIFFRFLPNCPFRTVTDSYVRICPRTGTVTKNCHSLTHFLR